MPGHTHLNLPDSVISIKGDIQVSPEKLIFRIPGREIKLHNLFSLFHNGISDKKHIKTGCDIRYRTDKWNGKRQNRIVIDIDVIIQIMQCTGYSLRVNEFPIIYRLPCQDELFFLLWLPAKIIIGKNLL